ncbi:MAG: DUF6220 domain-containing protein [bacterium]
MARRIAHADLEARKNEPKPVVTGPETVVSLPPMQRTFGIPVVEDGPTTTFPGEPTPVVAKRALPAWRRGFGHVFPWLAFILLACVLVQVYLAGRGLLVAGQTMAAHTTFVHVFELLPLAMIPCAAVGRLGHFAIWGSVAMQVLIEVQYPLIKATNWVRAIHPVNALLIFGLALLLVARFPFWATWARPRAR